MVEIASLTDELFEPLTGGVFRFSGGDSGEADLVLKKVSIIGPAYRAADHPVARANSFSLTFVGPKETRLPQQMYLVENSELGRIDGLFITAVGMDADGILYEAIFN